MAFSIKRRTRLPEQRPLLSVLLQLRSATYTPTPPPQYPTPPHRNEPKKKFPSRPRIRIRENPTRRSLHHCTRRPSAVLSSAQCTAPQQPFFSPFLQLQNIFRTASEIERERGRKSFPTGMMLDASSAVSGHQLSASFLLSCLCLRCTLGLGGCGRARAKAPPRIRRWC